jgi:hypothetical protein
VEGCNCLSLKERVVLFLASINSGSTLHAASHGHTTRLSVVWRYQPTPTHWATYTCHQPPGTPFLPSCAPGGVPPGQVYYAAGDDTSYLDYSTEELRGGPVSLVHDMGELQVKGRMARVRCGGARLHEPGGRGWEGRAGVES